MISDDTLQKICIKAIRNYLNVEGRDKWTDEYILNNFSEVIELMINSYKEKQKVLKVSDVSSFSQGDQSISFNSSNYGVFLTSEVISLLPSPFIRML